MLDREKQDVSANEGPLLAVRGLSKSFGGLQALKDVSFDVGRGQIVGIVGPNGAGKTTLFNCISGYSPFNVGKVVFRGAEIGGRTPHDICRAGLARTFQLVKPFRDMTVLENAMVGAFAHAGGGEARDKAAWALEALGMQELADRDASALLTADLRRLEIARAIATQPQLLLLDETLAGLTGSEAQDMCARIGELRQRGITILMIEHSVPIIRNLCDQTVVLNFGAVIGSGAPAEALAARAVQEAYLGTADHADA